MHTNITLFFLLLSFSLQSQNNKRINFLNDFSLKTEVGLTNFESALNKSSYSNSYGFAILKKLGSVFEISSHWNVMNIEAVRDLDAARNSYNPYGLYEGNGDYFKAKMSEIGVVISGKIPRKILSLGETFIFPKDINVSLNIGAALCNFYSIKYNSISNSYIYSYGYNDLQADYETTKSFWDLPKARVLIYGISVDYKLDKYSRMTVSCFVHDTDNLYIDSDSMTEEGDNVRNISIAYITSFKSLQKKFND